MKTKLCPKCKRTLKKDSFAKHSKRKDGLQPYCRDCKKLFDRSYYTSSRQEQIKRNKNNRLKCLSWLNDYKSKLGCDHCEEKDPRCLDMHHKDPSEKTSTVSSMAHKGCFKMMKEEVKKCLVVCANCHRKIHAKETVE